MPALVEVVDLSDYPGAPFTTAVVESAAESVRDEAGWHIAPEVTETLTVVSKGGTALLIPSLRYTITAVRDVTDPAAPEAITNYVDRGAGILHRSYGWATDHKYEVVLTHGYATCPPALKPVIAHRAQAAKMPGGSVSLGSLSTGFSNPADARTEQDAAIIARYSLR